MTDKLPWLIILAGVIGYSLPDWSNSFNGLTPWLLALMVAGSGFCLPLRQLFQFRGSFRLTLLALAAQLILLPVIGFGLYQLLPASTLAIGMLALGVAPCEITSAVMTMLAKGDLALATRLMAFSIFLAAFLTPLWLGLFLGKSVPLDTGGMAVELGLVISLPFLLASLLRSRFEGLYRYESEFGALSALAVVLLIFVVGGTLAQYRLSLDLVWLAGACLLFNLLGYLLGLMLGGRRNRPERTALIFTSGMREFGIATTVALNFLPAGAAVAPALYGLIMMLSASVLATQARSRVSALPD